MGTEDRTYRRVTIKDIAERCGVTANTVSRALRGDTGISEATRAKVRQTAQEMGYIRNHLAATMRSGRSNLISIIVDDIGNPYYAALIDEMNAALKENGYRTMTLCTRTRPDEMLEMANLSIANYVDGILYFPCSDDTHVVKLIQKALNRWCLSAERLRGRLRMWCALTTIREAFRRKGFVERLVQCGVKASDITVIEEEVISGAIRDKRFMDALLPVDYTGIFAFNDQIAYHAMNALREYGCRVPEDVSVIGFDHMRGFLHYLQPLTSIAGGQAAALARRSAALLMRRIQEPDAPFVSEILPVILHEGESTVAKL